MRASCSAFSSSACRACSTSWFLRFHLLVLLGQQPRLLLQLLVGLLQLLLPALQLAGASDCDCLSRSSVRMLASIVLITMPMLSVSWSRNAWWRRVEALERRQLEHALDLALEHDRQHQDVAAASIRSGRMTMRM